MCACGLDDLIACGLTQVVAALSLRPSAFGLGACAFAWVHQLDPRDPTRLGQGAIVYLVGGNFPRPLLMRFSFMMAMATA